MGAFSDLLAEARRLGADVVTFEVSLDGFVGVTDARERWSCWSTLSDHRYFTGEGRTGEEALRRLVESLKRNEGT